MSALMQAARSRIRWHLPVTYGTAVRLQVADHERRRAALDARVNALFGAMASACDAAGLHGDAEQCRIAARNEPPAPDLRAVEDLSGRVDAIERGLVSAYQDAHWPAGDDVQAPKRDRHGLRALPSGES